MHARMHARMQALCAIRLGLGEGAGAGVGNRFGAANEGVVGGDGVGNCADAATTANTAAKVAREHDSAFPRLCTICESDPRRMWHAEGYGGMICRAAWLSQKSHGRLMDETFWWERDFLCGPKHTIFTTMFNHDRPG